MKKNYNFCKYLVSNVRGLFVFSIIGLLFVHIFSYVLPYVNKIIIDKFFYDKNFDKYLQYIFMFIFIMIFTKIVFRIEKILSYYIEEKSNAAFRKKFLNLLFSKNITEYSKHNYGEIETIYNDSLPMISNSIYCITESLIAIPVAIILGGGLIINISPFLSVFLMIEIITMMITAKVGSIKRSEAYKRTLRGRKKYFGYLEKTINSFEGIRSNFLKPFVFERLFDKCDDYKLKNLRYHNINSIIMSIFDCTDIIFEIGTLIFFILMIKLDKVTPGDYFAYVSMKIVFVGVFNGLAQISLRYKELDVAVDEISSLIDIGNLSKNHDVKKRAIVENISNIAIKDVHFSYGKETSVFKLNFNFKKGNIYVIHGENGVGKSTLIRLLTGLLKPNKGKICINDQDINSFMDYQLSGKIKVLTQNVTLFDDSIARNLMLTNTNYNKKDIDLSMEKYFDITDILSKYKNGLESNVFEDGIKLSGGQKKKIAIQSMFCSNADVLIFDEPFSELDAKSKDIFYECLKEIRTHKIVIIISHQRNWNWNANEVFLDLVLKDNNSIEIGL